MTNFAALKQVLMKNTDIEKTTSYRDGDIIIVDGMKELGQNILDHTDKTILLMCKNGKIQIAINGHVIMMEESDLLFILPHAELSNLMFSADVECSAICLLSMRVEDFLRTQDLLNLLIAIRKQPLLHLDRQQFINLVHLKETINTMFSTSHPYYEQIMSHFVEIILYDIFGSYKDAVEKIISESVDEPNRRNNLFSAFINLLQADKGLHREVSYFANILHISAKYLSQISREVSGRACSQWIAETVTDEIKRLLSNTDLSIKEIADRLMFDNHSFFSKYVRKHLGCSPMEFRQQSRTSG